MFSLVKKAVYAGLGMGSQGYKNIDELVRRGEESQTECAKAVRKLLAEAEKNATKLEEKGFKLAERALEKMSIPTRSDLKRIEDKIQELSVRMERGRKG